MRDDEPDGTVTNFYFTDRNFFSQRRHLCRTFNKLELKPLLETFGGGVYEVKSKINCSRDLENEEVLAG